MGCLGLIGKLFFAGINDSLRFRGYILDIKYVI
jgi:hypothetical protein